MKKIIAIAMVFVVFLSLGIYIDNSNHVDVLIYTSIEDYRIADLQKHLDERFPNYKIEVQYMSTSKTAAKIQAEGDRAFVDIVMDLEYTYLMMLEDNFVKLDFMDKDKYLDELVISDYYMPNCVFSVGVVVNEERLKNLNLPMPLSYDDLLNPIYKDEIVMPSPKASSTGYTFIKGLLNLYGETDGWKYIDELNKNMKMYSSSGIGPVNSLILGEAAIGVGFISNVVSEINKGAPLKIVHMKEGNPYNVTGTAILKGNENNKKVLEVYKYIQDEYVVYDTQYYEPGKLYKEELETFIPNYPDLKPMDMTGFDSLKEKERILGKWKY